MKGFILVFLLIISSLLLGKDILTKTNPRTYQINVQTTVVHKGPGTSKTALFLAHLGSNQYQKCYRNKIDSLAKIIQLGSVGDSCIHYNLELGRKLQLGKRVILQNEFLIEIADISVNIDAIDTVYPYDYCDPNYEKYIGSNRPFINVEQKQLFNISELIWANSSGILDYAENCYLYVAKTFKYGLPLSGFKNLEFTLKNRMGDCGNLSSVFITLLRMKNIPARHLMGFRPDGTLHVWADFYMANYGWIPVDITYKQNYPDGNYFGNIEFENNGFIVQRGIGHEISALETPMRITGLQTYSYQVNYSKEHNVNINIDRDVTCQIKRVDTK